MKRRAFVTALALAIASGSTSASQGGGVPGRAPGATPRSDPYLVIRTVGLGAQADTSLYSENGGVSNGAGGHVFAGVTGNQDARRALLRFDVHGTIPAGATILTAELHLHVTKTQIGLQPFRLHRVTAPWTEGTTVAGGNGGAGGFATGGDATWTHARLGGDPWMSPGGDYLAAPSAESLVEFAGSSAR